MTPFELPPQSPDERDRRLALLEAREEHRELATLDADRAAEKWPASPCRTCSPVYRARRVRCPICRQWKAT
jgi:hypothetical protein